MCTEKFDPLLCQLGMAMERFLRLNQCFPKEKGRNVALWTILALIPVVNFACIWFFIGATNLKLERKIDDLIQQVKIAGEQPLIRRIS